MSVRYTHDDLRDLDQISSYLADRNIAAGAALLEAIEALVSCLERFPYSAQQTERVCAPLRCPAFHTSCSTPSRGAGLVIH
jgi:hypothetical protein